MNKKLILQAFIDLLNQELQQCIIAAEQAHLAATDDQSVAETQYDTLAIEAGYLAEGQSKRVFELKNSLQQLQNIPIESKTDSDPITLGALVKLETLAEITVKNKEESTPSITWYLLAPAGGGYKIKQADKIITLVTPSSPLGKALLNKYVDDEITYTVGPKCVQFDVVAIA